MTEENMSKLEKLIQQYCPDGVEYVRLGDVMSIQRGASPRPIQNYLTDDEYGIPWIKIGDVSIESKYITSTKERVTKEGAAKSRFLKRGSFILSNSMSFGRPYILEIDGCIHDGWISMCDFEKHLLPDFLYYLLRSSVVQDFWISKANSGGAVTNLNSDIVRSTLIPVPPLPVQEEIVRVLDRFTELQAELQKRLQQYNYYRDNLLTNFTPEQAPKEYTLGEVTVDIYSGATPSKEKREYWVNGTIPWMSSGEVNLGQVYEVEGRITQLGYDKCSTKMVPEGSVVIALAGQGKTRGTVAILRTSVCTNQSLAALVPQKEIVSGEYLYYYLKTQYAKLREVSAGDGTRGGLNLKMLRAYKVVIPSHKTQDQIVSILNRFDTLTNNLTSGLPAEMEKRRQQYEFYRDTLLTFKRKEA